VFWDIENCQVPSDCKAQDAVRGIRRLLGPLGPAYIRCFGNPGATDWTPAFPSRIIKELLSSGVHCAPTESDKQAADRAILSSMCRSVRRNPDTPIVLISGDKDFNNHMRVFREMGVFVIRIVRDGDFEKYEEKRKRRSPPDALTRWRGAVRAPGHRRHRHWQRNRRAGHGRLPGQGRQDGARFGAGTSRTPRPSARFVRAFSTLHSDRYTLTALHRRRLHSLLRREGLRV
jgi:hypothetical protein